MANETEKDKKHREQEAERRHAEGRKMYKSQDEGDERKRGERMKKKVLDASTAI
jgi:hypothetical protein